MRDWRGRSLAGVRRSLSKIRNACVSGRRHLVRDRFVGRLRYCTAGRRSYSELGRRPLVVAPAGGLR